MKRTYQNKKKNFENDEFDFDLDLKDEDLERIEFEATQRFQTQLPVQKPAPNVETLELSYININDENKEFDQKLLKDKTNKLRIVDLKKDDEKKLPSSNIHSLNNINRVSPTTQPQIAVQNPPACHYTISCFKPLNSVRNAVTNTKAVLKSLIETPQSHLNSTLLESIRLANENIIQMNYELILENDKLDLNKQSMGRIYELINSYIFSFLDFFAHDKTSLLMNDFISFLKELFVINLDDFKSFYKNIDQFVISFITQSFDSLVVDTVNVDIDIDKWAYLILFISSHYSWESIIEQPNCVLNKFCCFFENFNFSKSTVKFKTFQNIVFAVDDMFQNHKSDNLKQCSMKCACLSKYLSVFVGLTHQIISKIDSLSRKGKTTALEQAVELLNYCVYHIYLLESFINKKDANCSNLNLKHMYVMMAGVPLLHKHKQMTSAEVMKLDELLAAEPMYDDTQDTARTSMIEEVLNDVN